jgi:hypothetical protein
MPEIAPACDHLKLGRACDSSAQIPKSTQLPTNTENPETIFLIFNSLNY